MSIYYKAFVLGNPIQHSKSPFIHQYWLQFYDLDGEYCRIEKSETQLGAFIDGLKKSDWQGGNVTLPFKEQIINFLDDLTDEAKAIGSVNTLYFENEKLIGHNTDAYGFIENLNTQNSDSCWKTALILGAGGAARAIIYALKQKGVERIIVTNRHLLRAQNLANYFHVESCAWTEINDFLSQIDLLVNATSLGMGQKYEEGDLFSPLDWSLLPSTTLVTDIVYTPLQTIFLQNAQKRGLKTVDGLGMLLHQAVPAFKKWFGVEPQVTKQLRDVIIDTMKESTA